MEENRFLRTYQEHKREKEQVYHNSRFDCLRDDRQPIRQDAGRFECLKESFSNQDVRTVVRENNRFSCLIDNNYHSYAQRPYENVTYLPRIEPRESVNTRMRRIQEEKKASLPPPEPVFSIDSNYHFPELGKPQESPSLSKMPKPKPEIKLPEPKPQKEMIVNKVVVPAKKIIMTSICFKNGKLETTDVYEDGSEIPESGMVTLKKPTYSSWASVIKTKSSETDYSENDEYY
jgi:hypothetical protein